MKDIELHEAARDGDIERLQHLLTAGQCDINGHGGLGWTPLHCAACLGHTQCVQLLLQHGADTSIQNEDGMTPLHCAAISGHTQCVQLLLQHGADASIQDESWRTPLHRAAIYGHTQCVQLLLQHGADTSIQDRVGMTPLHCAADHGHTQCVQLLLQHGADTSIQNHLRMTPLHRAADCGHTQCVQLLLQHGADTSIQDKKNRTPRMLAEEKERLVIVELLRRFEIHDIKVYIQTRTLEHLAEILDPEEYRIFNLNNLDPKCPDIFQFQKIQGVKDWIAKNNYTTIKDIKDGLLAANLLRLSRAAVEYYAEVVINISNMSPDEFESLCRTLPRDEYVYTQSSASRGVAGISLPLDHYRHDAFIAYSGEDEATIEPVLHQLKECGIQCFYAKEDLELGTYVIPSIIEAVSSSRHTIVFLSKSFIQSDWCQFELQYIIQNARKSKGHVVIPVVMNMAPEEIPRELSIWKYVLFDDEELIPNFLEAVKGPRDTPTYGQLRQENDVLRDEINVLRDENEGLRDEVRQLTAKVRTSSIVPISGCQST